MPLLFGLAMAVALLYFWLIGHWFARVLMTALTVPLGAVLMMALFATGPVTGWGLGFGAILGAVVGWMFARWPTTYYEGLERQMLNIGLMGYPSAEAPASERSKLLLRAAPPSESWRL
jgi:hypothetical protein